MTGLKTESDKADESESGLHPEGGDDRYKVGDTSVLSSGAYQSPGWNSHVNVVSNARAFRF